MRAGKKKVQQETRPRLPWWVLLVCVGLAALTSTVYWDVSHHDYIYTFDDHVYSFSNPYVRSGLNAESFRWAFSVASRDFGCNWHPLTWLSLMLDVEIFGIEKAGPLHIVNLLFHIAATLLLFLVLALMTRRVWPGAFVAALFAVHPLHVESVAWIAERKDVLSTTFCMLTMLAYYSYARRPSAVRYILVAISLALGLMAKPMLVSLPLVLLLMDYWPLGRTTPPAAKKPVSSRAVWQRLVLEKIPLFALCSVSAYMTWQAQYGGGAMATDDHFRTGVRIANALVSSVAYLVKMVYPMKLSVFYPHPGESIPVWHVVGSFIFLAAVTVFVIRARRIRQYLIVGWLWYLITLLPVIGLVQVGMQAMADRYTYVPLVGIFIMIAWGAADLLERQERRPGISVSMVGLAAAGGVIVLVLAGLCWRQVSYWKDDETLFRHALAVTKDNYRAHSNLGMALMKRDKLDEAERHYIEALKFNDGFVDTFNGYGQLLWMRGENDRAIPMFEKGLELDPGNLAVRFNLATALASAGRDEEALPHYEAVLPYWSDRVDVRFNMSRTLAALGRYGEAIEHLQFILQKHPNDLASMSDLSRIYSTARDPRYRNGAEAVRLATIACNSSPQPNPIFLRSLASAYAEVGQFPEAVKVARLAIEVATAQKNKLIRGMVEEELREFEQGRPWRK